MRFRVESINNKPDQLVDLEYLDHLKVNDMPQLLIESIGRIVRFNYNLQSINLENTGLNSQVLVGFLPALRHSKSLLCFHLGQNPGITKQVKAFWRRRLSIAPK